MYWGSAAPCKIKLKLWRRDFSLPDSFHGEQGWDRIRLLDLDPPLQARCWGCACGGGNGELWEEGELQPALVLLFQALLCPQKGTLRGCCHFSLPLGKLYRDVVGIRGLKAFPAQPWTESSVGRTVFHPWNRNYLPVWKK